MLKKILTIFIFVVTLNSSAFACACIGEITMIFTQITTYVTQNVSAATANTSILVGQINQNTAKINEENEQLRKLLEAEKYKNLEAERLVFLLNKKTLQFVIF